MVCRPAGHADHVEHQVRRHVVGARTAHQVDDILGSAERAVLIGELATRIKSSGRVTRSQFAIVLTISGNLITRFQMIEDSFDVSRAVSG